MQKRIARSEQELLDFSEEHLLYELRMLRWVEAHLPQDSGFPLSAMLESFAIHLRNLIDFFYTLPEDAQHDDVVAADFFDDPAAWNLGNKSKSLEDARQRANKEISHITLKRKSATDSRKPWPVRDLFKEVQVVAERFADSASSKRLHSSVKLWLKADPKTIVVILGGASANASNTATSMGSGGVSLSSRSASTASGSMSSEIIDPKSQ